MAISKKYLYSGDAATSCINVAAYLQENAVPKYFDSVSVSDDGASVICTVGGAEFLRYTPGLYSSSEDPGVFKITTKEGSVRSVTSSSASFSFVCYAFKCTNGIAFSPYVAGYLDLFSLVITKNNDGETTIISGSNFAYSSSNVSYMTTYNLAAVSPSCVSPFNSFVLNRAEYDLTTLVPFPCSGSMGNPAYTPNVFFMPQYQYDDVGILEINGNTYLSNGYWALLDLGTSGSGGTIDLSGYATAAELTSEAEKRASADKELQAGIKANAESISNLMTEAESVKESVSGLGKSVEELQTSKANDDDVYNKDETYNKDEIINQIITKVAEIVAGAPENFDTLKELADWIDSHEDSAAAMNTAIKQNATDIANRYTKTESDNKYLGKTATAAAAVLDELGGNIAQQFASIYGLGTIIKSNSDLNDAAFLVPGVYRAASNAAAATLLNCPVKRGFRMEVKALIYSGISVRIIYPHSPNDGFYMQYVTSDGFGKWYRYIGEEVTTTTTSE